MPVARWSPDGCKTVKDVDFIDAALKFGDGPGFCQRIERTQDGRNQVREQNTGGMKVDLTRTLAPPRIFCSGNFKRPWRDL